MAQLQIPTYQKGDRVTCQGYAATFLELLPAGLACIELDKRGLDADGVRCLKTRWTVSVYDLEFSGNEY